ncbi:MAG: sigma-70 family RNA polymerase sigma factor [Planctomycetes bacterium]|nr:sigma-70 family RNA polymerase sigma factor [Planctomycetota bacterium]
MSAQTQESADSSSSVHSTLLNAVRMRDPEAWQRLVQLFSLLIYDWCRQQGLQRADAADVTQDVFQAVMNGLDSFRRDRPEDSFRGWLWTITRNKIHDFYRAQAMRPGAYGGTDAWDKMQQVPEEEPLSHSTTGTTDVSISPLHRALEIVRNDFNESTWQAFWRVTIENQQAVEVSGDLGISVNAVRKAKARVLRRLREEFGDLLQ